MQGEIFMKKHTPQVTIFFSGDGDFREILFSSFRLYIRDFMESHSGELTGFSGR